MLVAYLLGEWNGVSLLLTAGYIHPIPNALSKLMLQVPGDVELIFRADGYSGNGQKSG